KRAVSGESGGENWCQGRDRAIHQAGQPWLDNTQQQTARGFLPSCCLPSGSDRSRGGRETWLCAFGAMLRRERLRSFTPVFSHDGFSLSMCYAPEDNLCYCLWCEPFIGVLIINRNIHEQSHEFIIAGNRSHNLVKNERIEVQHPQLIAEDKKALI